MSTGIPDDAALVKLCTSHILEGDVRKLIKTPYRIVATYQKLLCDGRYEECVYVAKKVAWDKLTYPADWGTFRNLEQNKRKRSSRKARTMRYLSADG